MTGILSNWHQHLSNIKEQGLGDEVTRLDAANAILPGRVNLYSLTSQQLELLEAAAAIAWQGAGADDPALQLRPVSFCRPPPWAITR